MKTLYLLFLLGIFFIPGITGENHFTADIEISVTGQGEVTITGDTDYPGFKNISKDPSFTDKKGKYWTLNLSTKERFSSYAYRLTLPSNSNINYLRTTKNVEIKDENKLILTGKEENEPFLLVVQYSRESTAEESVPLLYSLLGALTLLILAGGLWWHFRKRARQDKTSPDDSLSRYTERQQMILKYLNKHERVTQKELEINLDMPKASLSRNLNRLKVLGIIDTYKVGQSKVISRKKRE